MDGVMFTFREAIKHMKQHGGGSLVVTSSGTARFGAAGSEHYSATKAGVIALIQSLAVGQARYGIRANAVIPGLDRNRHDGTCAANRGIPNAGAEAHPATALGASQETFAPLPCISPATRAAITPAIRSPLMAACRTSRGTDHVAETAPDRRDGPGTVAGCGRVPRCARPRSVLRRPGVGPFRSRKRTVLPLGNQFIELLAPIRENTAGGRYLVRRNGAGGLYGDHAVRRPSAAPRAHSATRYPLGDGSPRPGVS